MFRKTLIAVAVLAVSPAIALAAPMTTATTITKPAITQSVKAEKVKVVKAHHTAKKVKVTSHLRLKAKSKVNKI